MEPFVIGIVLKVETHGWSGAPPLLPNPPVKIDEGRDGLKVFYYDLSPKQADIGVADACLRLGSRLERMLSGPKSPFPEGSYAIRCTLEFGILADRERQSFGYSWPLEFLQALVDSNVELRVTHYLPRPDDDDAAEPPRPTDDVDDEFPGLTSRRR